MRLDMFTKEHQRWIELYAGAIVELDPQKLEERIVATKLAIQRRLEHLETGREDHEERRQIGDAIHCLQTLERTNRTSGQKSAGHEGRPHQYEIGPRESSACGPAELRGRNADESTVSQKGESVDISTPQEQVPL